MEVPFEQSTSVCRGCLSTGRGMLHAKRFEAEFKVVTGINISPADGLPQLLCYECSALLQKCARFRNKVIKSHNLLCQYVHESIPFPYVESGSPHLSRTRIMYYEVPGAQPEQIKEQTAGEKKINSIVEDSGTPVISKVAKAGVKMEYVWPYDEDDIKLEENDAYVRERTELATQGRDVKDTTTSEVHESEQVTVKCEQTERSSDFPHEVSASPHLSGTSIMRYEIPGTQAEQIEEKVDGADIIMSVIDESCVPAISKIATVDIKIKSGCSDNIKVEECGVYVPEYPLLATNGKDTTLSKVKEQTEASSDVTNRDELLDNYEIIAHCDQTDDRSNEISRHTDVRDNHLKRTLNSVNISSPKNVLSYICDLCNRCFKTKVGIQKHMGVHSGNRPCKGDVSTKDLSSNNHNRIDIGNRYKCDVCMKCFKRKYALYLHQRTHTGGEKPHKCDVCMKYFAFKYNLTRHNKIHTGEKPYKCDVCMKCFNRKAHLIKHSRTHTGVTADGLTVHNIIHTGKKLHKCDVCMKCFVYKSYLTRHNRIHTGEKYKCDVCMKCFVYKCDLTVHNRIHTGEKPYKCDVCMKCFAHKRILTIHNRTHTGEKPYKCDVCMKCFTSKGHLTRHNRIHTLENTFKCDVCTKCFTNKSHLIKHIRLHTGQNPF